MLRIELRCYVRVITIVIAHKKLLLINDLKNFILIQKKNKKYFLLNTRVEDNNYKKKSDCNEVIILIEAILEGFLCELYINFIKCKDFNSIFSGFIPF